MIVNAFFGILLAFCLYKAVAGLVSVTFSSNVSGGLISASSVATVTANEAVTANPTVPAAIAGTLTTHTTNTTGSLTMPTGHGLITGQRVDIYWDVGQCYGAILGTVSGNVCPIASVAGGTALPASGYAVTVAPTVLTGFSFIGDNAQALVESSGNVNGYFVIESSGAVLLANYVLAVQAYSWRTGVGANPLGSGVLPTKLYVSQNSTYAANTSMMAGAYVN